MLKKPVEQKINRTNAITNRRLIEASVNGRKLFRNHRGKAYQGKAIQIRNELQLNKFVSVIKNKMRMSRLTNNGYNINFVIIENPRFCEFGLFPGAGDLIGWEEIIVSKEMIGKKLAIFTSEEIKSINDRMSEFQKTWNNVVKMAGGNSDIIKEQKDGSVKVL